MLYVTPTGVSLSTNLTTNLVLGMNMSSAHKLKKQRTEYAEKKRM